ncbi:MAG: BMP family ABC transporter substrate-binding protein, partial [Acidimicrobiia bacterium]
MKRFMRVFAALAALSLVLAACADDAGDTTTTAGEATTTAAEEPTTTAAEATTTAAPGAEAIKTCLVTDLAGVDDRSFN